MAKLDKVLGSVLSSLAQARRMADEESVAIAEQYRSQAPLEGLSIPRFRLPEVVVDIPVIVGEEHEARPDKIRPFRDIMPILGTQLLESAETLGVSLPQATRKRFETSLRKVFAEFDLTEERADRESFMRAVDSAFKRSMESEPQDRLDARQRRTILAAIRRKAHSSFVAEPRSPAGVEITVVTEKIKEHADPESITRLRLTLREEGLEWNAADLEDGTTRRFLLPE